MKDFIEERRFSICLLNVCFLKEEFSVLEAEEYLVKNISRHFLLCRDDDDCGFYTFKINDRMKEESESRILYNDVGDIMLEYELV